MSRRERRMGSQPCGEEGEDSISEGTALLGGWDFLHRWPREPTTHSLTQQCASTCFVLLHDYQETKVKMSLPLCRDLQLLQGARSMWV